MRHQLVEQRESFVLGLRLLVDERLDQGRVQLDVEVLVLDEVVGVDVAVDDGVLEDLVDLQWN